MIAAGLRRITVTYFDEKDGSKKTVQAPVGVSLMETAHANDIDLEGDRMPMSRNGRHQWSRLVGAVRCPLGSSRLMLWQAPAKGHWLAPLATW